MKPAPFDYHAPQSVAEALELLARYGRTAAVLAGGQSLVAQLNSRERQPEQVIDIGGIADLNELAVAHDELVLGAMVRQADAEAHPMIRLRFRYLSKALELTASTPVKNRGTVVGSLSHADPSGELPAVSLCMGTEIVAASSARGERSLPISEFLVGPFQNALEPDELLVRARFPALDPSTGFAIRETQRRHNGVATAGAAAWVRQVGGRVESARLVAYGLGTAPRICESVEGVEGCALADEDTLRENAARSVETLEARGDVLASETYRRQAVRTLASRALIEAVVQAREAT